MDNNKSDISKKEEEVLKFWQENKIFNKTLEKESPNGNFVFYEGPPTANAKPALHHLEARSFKDVIPRFKTMNGFYVRRKGGWDTHGLPVELQIEKKLGLKSKKEIEVYGVEKFNKECKDSVFEYISDWEVFTDRIGYWVDKENAYYTFDTEYIESAWNILKTVNDRGLLYKDYKVLPWCPRCGTALSSHELAQGYQDDKDLSVTAEFRLKSESGTSILAWTTTPWTLPGNVALAVGMDIEYVEVKKVGEENNKKFILAKDRVNDVFGDNQYEIIRNIKGSDLVGLEYEPLYDFLWKKFMDKNPEAFARAFRVYPADFVNTQDGTGIVHTAVMYGQDDFDLGSKENLPKFHLVKEDGHFLDDMDFLSERFVKDEEVAVDIIKDLAKRGLLFKKEKYEHSYPHCWRCKTPLIYYARDSWYIKMSSLRDELMNQNKDIKWEPSHIKEGRFGEWLKEVKDWAISRERYWGTPLPVWFDEKGNYRIIGGIDELKKLSKKSQNRFFSMRHGQAKLNVDHVLNYDKSISNSLTDEGKKQILDQIKFLDGKSIDIIISSPFDRTLETAHLVAENLGLPKEKVLTDDRLEEWNFGKEYEGKKESDLKDRLNNEKDKFNFKTKDGESFVNILKRVGNFIYNIDQKYSDKNILIISHAATLRALSIASSGFSLRYLDKVDSNFKNYINAEVREMEFIPLPHNSNYEIDLHKPYIDDHILYDENGSSLKRVKEVMDVWFDSGIMPFAQDHFPWNEGELLYPADFISEAIDQTRGWFYTLHAVGVLLGKGKAYKNVICLGHILDSNGKKMSKSVGNIIDPWLMINKYGVDAVRLWMYTVNSPGDSKNFDEKTLDEIVKKVFNPILNIISLYDLYKDGTSPSDKSSNILDKWIINRLNKMVKEGTGYLNNFQVFESARLIRDFVNDFSTWYIRRSRDRFKSDNLKERGEVLATTSFVLLEFSKYIAPFIPFFAESVFQKVKTEGLSVHLENWPKINDFDDELLSNMNKAREIVTSALEMRQNAGFKVRQPLSSLTISQNLSQGFLDIISDEVNVKNILIEDGGQMKLDINITEELKYEGLARDIIRGIQDARKSEGLNPSESIKILVNAESDIKDIFHKMEDIIKTPTQVMSWDFSEEKQKYQIFAGEKELSISIFR